MDNLREQIDWSLFTAEEITKRGDHILSHITQVHDTIVNEPSARTLENTFLPYVRVDNMFSLYSNIIGFLVNVSSDKVVRDTSDEVKKRLKLKKIEENSRRDVYLALLDFQKNCEADLAPLELRLLEKYFEIFIDNGLNLPEDQRLRLLELKKKISLLEQNAVRNISEENSRHYYSCDQLTGCSATFLDGLEKNSEGLCEIRLKYPHVLEIMRHCTNPETRKDVHHKMNSVAPENLEILDSLVKLRAEAALVRGYENHASFVLEYRVAKKPQNVKRFLDDLVERSQEASQNHLQTLVELKKQEMGEDEGKIIHIHDLGYYLTKNKELKNNVKDDVLRTYFPLEKVLDGLFTIYQDLFSLHFEPVSETKAWHPDVLLFELRDRPTQQCLGYFYLDLYPRDGKYGHAAAFTLRTSMLLDGVQSLPASAMVCNFTRGFLSHDEINTLFHEMGHILHQLLGATPYSKLSGTRVETDFVEAPSQMLENWVFEPLTLEKISEPTLPQQYIDALRLGRTLNLPLSLRRQLAYALYDYHIHTWTPNKDPLDLMELYRNNASKINHINNSLKTCDPASWGHLYGGYDASYYGYLWGEVYSADFFQVFIKGGILNTEIGTRYRKLVLEVGGSRDGADICKDFLGREPTPDAFLIQNGLQ